MPHQPYQIGYLMSSPDDLSGPPLRQADPASLNTPADTPKTVGEDTSDRGTPSPSLPSGEVQEGTQGAVVRLPAPSPITVSSGSSEPGLTRCGPDDPIRGVQILGVPDDSVASTENALAYLSEELSLINTGYGHYYMGGRELALQRYSAVLIETPLLRRAISVVTALLDLGIQNETSGAEVRLTTGSWFRLARLVMAATMRGANQSEGLEKAGDMQLRPCLDVFHIHKQLTVPETEAESLQLMAEQLVGKLKGERGLGGGDGNPETIYDAILSKRMANFEAHVEAEERLKAAEWTTTLCTCLEGEEFDAFLLSLQKEMEGHEYTVEVRKNFMDNLLNLWTKRREEILRDVESQFCEEARMCKEEERRVLKQKLVEEGRVEALRGAEAELTVWKQMRLQELKNDAFQTLQHEALKVNDNIIEEQRLGELADEKERHLEAAKNNIDEHVKNHYEAFKMEALDKLRLQTRRDAESEARQEKVRIYNKKVAQHEQTIQRALREESRPLLLKATRELGMAISAEDSTTLIAAAPPRSREDANVGGRKRRTSDQQVDNAVSRGRSHSCAPTMPATPTRAGKGVGIYGGEICTPSVTSSAHTKRPDAEGEAPRAQTPTNLRPRGTSGSMHARNPAGLLEMESVLVLPAAFSDEGVRGTDSSIHNLTNVMPVDEAATPPEPEAPPGRADFFGTALGELSAEQRFMLTAIQRLIEPITKRLFVVEKKLIAQEQQGIPRLQPSRPPPTTNQRAPPPPPALTPAAHAGGAAGPAEGNNGIIPI
ncbi:hypothetical protein EDB89DRAFT_2136372 [Lactarius sanguifluus]|nr:hypothetical protein EDB89DRAFT_2136372 [Lactarius sanguifluus]